MALTATDAPLPQCAIRRVLAHAQRTPAWDETKQYRRPVGSLPLPSAPAEVFAEAALSPPVARISHASAPSTVIRLSFHRILRCLSAGFSADGSGTSHLFVSGVGPVQTVVPRPRLRHRNQASASRSRSAPRGARQFGQLEGGRWFSIQPVPTARRNSRSRTARPSGSESTISISSSRPCAREIGSRGARRA